MSQVNLTDLKDKILDLIEEVSIPYVKSLSTTYICWAGKTIRNSKSVMATVADFVDQDKLNDEEAFTWMKAHKATLCEEIYLELLEDCRQGFEALRNKPHPDLDPTTANIISQLSLVHLFQTGGYRVLHNGRLSNITLDFVAESVIKEKLTQMKVSAKLVYPMYRPEPGQNSYIDYAFVPPIEIPILDTYDPPTWLKRVQSGDITPADQPDPLFFEFYEHFIPDPESREFVWDWTHHVLTDRAMTYLYISGGQGTGKGTKADIMTMLVGQDNAERTTGHFNSQQFKGYLKNCQFTYLDEYTCQTLKEKNELKRQIEDTVTVELKGVDPETVPNRASYMIANNDPTSVWVEPVDRRMSCVSCTHVDLVKAKGKDWVENFKQRLFYDTEFLASFGMWIMNRKPKYPKSKPYQKKRFEECVKYSTYPELEEIIDTFTREEAPETFRWSTARAKYIQRAKSEGTGGQRFIRKTNFAKFFREFRWDGLPIVEVEYSEGDKDVVLRRIDHE